LTKKGLIFIKTSKYTLFFPDINGGNKQIMYNSLTSSLALIDDDHFGQYLAFKDENITIKDEKFYKDLKRGGFIIDEKIDELELIRHDMYKAKFNSNQISLTIAPTLECNFGCIYCFEKEVVNKRKMSKETADYIIEFIKEKSKIIKSLNVYWYGGEPLLAIDMINYLSSKIIEICKKNNIAYLSSIITNGYLLTDSNIESLIKSNISMIQVTVDGDRETHNKRRPLKGGGASFDTIISNLKSIKKYGLSAQLRINIDEENGAESYKIVDILKDMDLLENVFPYLAPVKNYDNCYLDEKCISSYDYLNMKKRFNDYIKAGGFKSIAEGDNLPRRINSVCTADKANDLVIGADGELYKCWTDIGKEELSIGNIKSGICENLIYFNYIMTDPTFDLKCKECSYLPICLSGCPNDRKNKEINLCPEVFKNTENAIYNIVKDYNIDI